jgi:hypothetical protein
VHPAGRLHQHALPLNYKHGFGLRLDRTATCETSAVALILRVAPNILPLSMSKQPRTCLRILGMAHAEHCRQRSAPNGAPASRRRACTSATSVCKSNDAQPSEPRQSSHAQCCVAHISCAMTCASKSAVSISSLLAYCTSCSYASAFDTVVIHGGNGMRGCGVDAVLTSVVEISLE